MDYKATLNLPRTDFPMRANLPKREPEMLRRWATLGLYGRMLARNAGRPRFVLHDGPPYANGDIHLGHALDKVLKDIVVKSRSMGGWLAPYVPGWDCHGLPIEIQVEKEIGRAKKERMPKAEVRALCREYAARFVDIQRGQFERLGVLGDWQHPYLTMDFDYEAREIRLLGRCIEVGLLYRRKRPVQWCWSCLTALAEAEVEYADITSPSVYVAYPFVDPLPEPLAGLQGVAAAAWTTTPWTLPASLAVAVHPDHEYVAIALGGRTLVVAAALVPAHAHRLGERVTQADTKIIAHLRAMGTLLAAHDLVHSYPHCWRCKNSIVYRATEQWFIGMELADLRQKALDEIDRIHWVPEWGRDRMHGMVATRPDWCLSRQRDWGVPIIALFCEACGAEHTSRALCDHVAAIFEREGADAWYTRPIADLVPPATRCARCGGTEFRRETDILDVWFDSGVSWSAVVEGRPELGGRADMYLEGSDQHRGWFQSSLLTCVAVEGRAPYDVVLTHGFFVDGTGRKMSKSYRLLRRKRAVLRRRR